MKNRYGTHPFANCSFFFLFVRLLRICLFSLLNRMCPKRLSAANDRQTGNDPQIVPQLICDEDRK